MLMLKTTQIIIVFQLCFVAAFDGDASMIQVYVSNFDDGTVSVIDAETNSVTATVPVGKRPVGIVAHPDGNRVYVANRNSNTLSVIDTMTNEVSASVPMSGAPFGVDINSDGGRVYVANRGAGTIDIVDTATDTVTSRIDGTEGSSFVAVAPDGGSVYAGANDIKVFDAAVGEELGTVTTSGLGPVWSMAVHPDGTRLYVNNSPPWPGKVGVIDTAMNTLTSTITVGKGATGIAVHPDGESVYVSNRDDDTISVIDTNTNLVASTISVNAGDSPHGLAIHPNGDWLYVTNKNKDSVSVIDIHSGQVFATIPVGGSPNLGIAIAVSEPPRELRAGDADQDYDFDQFDLVQVQVAAKYLTGQAASWGEGDWDGAPGGSPGNPPAGDGVFNQFDIIAAQQGATYLTGPYAAMHAGGTIRDGQTSVIYDADTGEVAVDAPAGVEMTSVNIDSAAGVFTGQAAANLDGNFDNDADANIFKTTFGGSFGSISFGNVARTGLSEAFVLDDLSLVGSLAGGGDLGEVDLVYVPEPTSVLLLSVGLMIGLFHFRRVALLVEERCCCPRCSCRS